MSATRIDATINKVREEFAAEARAAEIAERTLDELVPVTPTWEPSPSGNVLAARTRELRTVDGWEFVQAAAETVASCWGERDVVVWAKGEPLMIFGPDGVGKTSVGQQLTLARLRGGKL